MQYRTVIRRADTFDGKFWCSQFRSREVFASANAGLMTAPTASVTW
jgi:hypothetical protein